MIKQLLNSVIAKYRDLSVYRRSIICLSLRIRQITLLLATEKSRYFGQPRPIIVISINTQVIIQNRALSLARYLGLSADNHLDGQNGCQ